ncbi:uncharacterized protein LOC128639905 isoform X1 [Bombina bombina]|uniref:uncharacterized protein LOC128639905 isoform X1 n=1 Tax=Bombina bombina TaxID=8345 RepID=UPI00235A578E|nr:uncharacterized protein LOC128639905 isoform X1 [Bombina bombina]
MKAMANSPIPLEPPIPALLKDDKYHLFISYSSGDSIWVYGLIRKLEDTFPILKICYHERDFLPGKTIIDNMVESIQSSQKILMVLSPDFVRSRWCLFEANLSFFRDCMGHKAIIPIMLRPCPMPLHLSHLTYLEAEDEQFFDKLCQVALTANDQMIHCSLVHYQSPLLYSGKAILTLNLVNEDREPWQLAVFSNSVPDSLRAFVDDDDLYKEAVDIVNSATISFSCLRFMACKVFLCIILILITCFCILFFLSGIMDSPLLTGEAMVFLLSPVALTVVILMPILFIKVVCWNKVNVRKITKQMVLKTGEANLILMKTSLLAGYSVTAQLFFVYVSLQKCRETFEITFGSDSVLATKMWRKAIVNYSSDYTCCLAKKHFPLNCVDSPGHQEGCVCFCQYF